MHLTKPTILDCTLRDGGYYNNWDFSRDLIADYFVAMDQIGVDFIEIGLRTLKNNGFKGGCAFSSDDFISSFKLPKRIGNKIGVMINASEIVINSKNIPGKKKLSLNKLKKLFPPSSKKYIHLVRIACHVDEVVHCSKAITYLKAEGYLVGINIMQITELDKSSLIQLVGEIAPMDADVLYFADSFGGLDASRIEEIISGIRNCWSGNLGFHAHNNMSKAMENTLKSIELGASWVDSTVTGMGRGAGNVETENLALHLQKVFPHSKFAANKLFDLIQDHFLPLKKKYEWGPNHFYFLSGMNSIHPSFVQSMMSDTRYNSNDILSTLDYLSKSGMGKKYNARALESTKQVSFSDKPSSWSPVSLIQSKDVLIIGTGPSANFYRSDLESFIKRKDLYVIGLNSNSSISESLIDVRAACHLLRFNADIEKYNTLPQALILPETFMTQDSKSRLKNKKQYFFSIKVGNKFSFANSYAEIPELLVMAYALSIATHGRPKRIFLAGFDGYPEKDKRNDQMISIFNSYQVATGAKQIISITPTSYPIPTDSVFNPNL